MSVQIGIWNLDGRPVDRERLETMTRQLAEYGPDGKRTHLSESIGIVYRPFYCTPESRLEQQPYESDDGKIITWDGRLDNREELIFELRNQLRDDQTDVAIFAAALNQWGTSCFSRIIGDWAAVIWNAAARELILARDYAGIKHLFFYHRQDSLMWSTHLAALAFSGDRFNPCDEYIAGYLAFQPDAHLTPYREIVSVPPGHFVRIRPQRLEEQRYWTFNPTSPSTSKTDAEFEEQFCYLFRQAVRSRLRSQSPILADLSGGLDSSSVVCMADDILVNDPPTTTSLDTFSFFDQEEPDDEDFPYLAEVEAKRGRLGHHAALAGSGDTFRLSLHEPEPSPGFGLRLELEAAKSSVVEDSGYRVFLSGNGGDQVLGQALTPGTALGDSLRQFDLQGFRRQLVAWSLSTRSPAIELIGAALMASVPARLPELLRNRTPLLPWVNPIFARNYGMAARVLPAGTGPHAWLPSVRLRYQQLTRLQAELTHSAPRCPQETRYPFLDRKLVEFLLVVPVTQLFRSGERRSLQRRAMAHLLPREIVRRRTKSGTGRCDITTLNKHWEEIESLLRAPISADLGYIETGQLRHALLQLKQGLSGEYVGQLLRALFLEVWLRDLSARGVITVQSEHCVPSLKRPRQDSASRWKLDARLVESEVTSQSHHQPDLRLLAELSNPKQKGGEHYAL